MQRGCMAIIMFMKSCLSILFTGDENLYYTALFTSIDTFNLARYMQNILCKTGTVCKLHTTYINDVT